MFIPVNKKLGYTEVLVVISTDMLRKDLNMLT